MATVTDRQPLTKRQQKIFDYVMVFREQHGYCVSVREIMQKFGISSPNGVTCHLAALRRKGWVTWEAHQARTIRAVEADHAEQ